MQGAARRSGCAGVKQVGLHEALWEVKRRRRGVRWDGMVQVMCTAAIR